MNEFFFIFETQLNFIFQHNHKSLSQNARVRNNGTRIWRQTLHICTIIPWVPWVRLLYTSLCQESSMFYTARIMLKRNLPQGQRASSVPLRKACILQQFACVHFQCWWYISKALQDQHDILALKRSYHSLMAHVVETHRTLEISMRDLAKAREMEEKRLEELVNFKAAVLSVLVDRAGQKFEKGESRLVRLRSALLDLFSN